MKSAIGAIQAFFGVLTVSILMGGGPASADPTRHVDLEAYEQSAASSYSYNEGYDPSQPKPRSKERYSNSYGYGKSFLNPIDDFDFTKLEALIKDGSLTSVEATLAAIKEQYPKSLEKYVIMYESRSLQQASPQNPRILALAGSKNMVFSFNGESTQTGFSQIEVMNFIPETSSFEFREISFSESKPAHFSGPNPAKCMNCHQASWRKQPEQNDPRPNWEPYNTWPGAIGSLDGELSMYLGTSHRFDNDKDRHLLEKHVQEAGWAFDWEDDIKPTHDRYKYLGDFVGPKFVLEFTKVLALQNSYRVGRIVTSMSEVYPLVRPSLVLLTNPFCDYNFHEKQKDPLFKTPSGHHRVVLSRELEDIYRPLGVNIEDWSMDFRTGGRLSSSKNPDKFRNPNAAEPFLAIGLEKFDPEPFSTPAEGIKAAYGSATYQRMTQNCQQWEPQEKVMRPRYEQLKASYQPPSHLRPVRREPSLMSRCVSCHTDEIAALDPNVPYIRFDDSRVLKQQLMQTGYKHGTLMEEIVYRTGEYAHSSERMPKGHAPSVSAVTDFIESLQALIAE